MFFFLKWIEQLVMVLFRGYTPEAADWFTPRIATPMSFAPALQPVEANRHLPTRAHSAGPPDDMVHRYRIPPPGSFSRWVPSRQRR